LKKRKSPTQGKQTPEKYLRTQARKLPIYECLINNGWDQSMMANILVTRKHSNGRYSSAVYLVDLYCLGVKGSEFFFNQREEEFTDFKNEFYPDDFFKTVDYTLIHNIIFAGIEFAEEYGFAPCKEFTKNTQFLLEEDTDDIEVIEIECGSDDMPVIIVGKDNKLESEKAYQHLLNTVGPDKFIYSDYEDYNQEISELMNIDNELNEKEIEFEENIPLEQYIYNQPLTERVEDVKRLRELIDYNDDTTEDESTELLFISNRLYYNYVGLDKIKEARKKYTNFLNVTINNETIDQHLSGTQSKDHDETILEIIDDLSFGDDLKKYNFKKLAKQHPEIQFYCFMHLVQMHLDKVNIKKIEKELDQYLSIYPNNLLLKLEKDQLLATNNKKTTTINDNLIQNSSLSKLFNKRKSIHSLEYFSFHSAVFAYLATKEDILGMDAFIHCSNELFPEFIEPATEKHVFSEMSKVFFCQKIYLEE